MYLKELSLTGFRLEMLSPYPERFRKQLLAVPLQPRPVSRVMGTVASALSLSLVGCGHNMESSNPALVPKAKCPLWGLTAASMNLR